MRPSREQSGISELILRLLASIYEPRDAKGRPTRSNNTPWHDRRNTLAQLLHLIAIRTRLRQFNLYDTEASVYSPMVQPMRVIPPPSRTDERTIDGSFNDLNRPCMGRARTRFGRNFPREFTYHEQGERLLTPSPRLVSNCLLKRNEFMPASSVNLLSAAWLQFMVHDWLGHGENDPCNPVVIPLEKNDPWKKRPMEVRRTRVDEASKYETGAPPVYLNTETHWWDASQLYGSSQDKLKDVSDGAKMKLDTINGDATLPVRQADRDNEPPKDLGIEIAGVNANWWLGLSLMHTLFAQEHNLIVDMLRKKYVDWDEERLFQKARLINAALMAKIHTIEWTPAFLQKNSVERGLLINWWGLIGKRVVRRYGRLFRSEFLSGIPGSDTRHHAADYSITEEFVAVYRMHGLLPDSIEFTRHDGKTSLGTRGLADVIGAKVASLYRDISHSDALYSFGVEHPGALRLHNYPNTLRDLERQGRTKLRIDLAAVDILRDRERGVPRYNTFRELIGKPRLRRWRDINPADKSVGEALKGVYHSVDDIDLMVGLYAEEPVEGFAFSETAFRVFILMANRRLKSDRFYTVDYTPETYTPEGIAWIEERSMCDVIGDHYPSLKSVVKHLDNAFFPWGECDHCRKGGSRRV